jgi:hypothetical protein
MEAIDCAECRNFPCFSEKVSDPRIQTSHHDFQSIGQTEVCLSKG